MRDALRLMVLLGAMVGGLFDAFAPMMPVYALEVLDVDPANIVFVFSTIPIGFLASTLAAPWLINRFGERPVMLVSVAMLGGSIVLFGLVHQVAPLLAPFSPLWLFAWFGIQPSEEVLAAGVIIIPTYAGFSAADAAAQTYVNRRLPVVQQAGAFGIESTLRSGLAVVGVLTFGIMATLFGTRPVFLIAPFIMVFLMAGIIVASYRYSDEKAPPSLKVMASFWHEEDEAPFSG